MVGDTGMLFAWVAVKGYANDWAVYVGRLEKPALSENDIVEISQTGDKVCSDTNIRSCVPCTDDVLKLYRK